MDEKLRMAIIEYLCQMKMLEAVAVLLVREKC
jgi:hypothetical protein